MPLKNKFLGMNKKRVAERFNDGWNFGKSFDTHDKRINRLAECVMKNMCGYRDSRSMNIIAWELGLITEKDTPTKAGKLWAYDIIMTET